MEKNKNILDVRNLSISFSVYGKITKVIDNISFSVGKGQRVGLVGESGCGKTTTLRAILHVLPSNSIVKSGEILFNGVDILKMSTKELEQFRRKGAGMIFQDPSSALNPVFTIGDQLTTALRYSSQDKVDKRAIYEHAKQALNDVYLADPERIMDSYPFQLSGGMKQRVCIAVTLAAGKHLLLADEPGTSLDVTIQDQILRLINELVLDKHLSVIMVSHSLGVIREVTSFVNIMYAGTIVESGETDIVFQQPKHPYTVSLMNCVPKLTGKGIAEGVPGRIPDYANPPLGCRFSPRCLYAQEICHKDRPPKVEVGPNHLVSCYFPNEVI